MKLVHKKLGDVSRFIRGITFKPTDLCDPKDEDAVVCMRTKNIQSELDESDLIAIPRTFVKRDEQVLEEGDLLVSSANSWNLVGKVCWVPHLDYEATAGGFISILRCDRGKVDPRYFYHWAAFGRTQEQLRNCGRQTTNISNLDFGRAANLEIPLPPSLDEQQRIAAILDKADGIRRKRQEALRLTDTFLRSVFLDLFGDPATNPKGWPIKPLSDGVASFEGGRNLMPTENDRSDRIRVLKVSAVTSGEYRLDESKSFAEDEEVQPEHMVREGDLLISRANTADLVGAVAFVWKTEGREMLPDKLWRFVWTEPKTLEPLFMLHMARSSYFRQQLVQRATGTSGSMKNIGKSKMLEIPIPLPPIAIQETFAEAARKAQASIVRIQQAREESDALFSVLQQRAFRGEL